MLFLVPLATTVSASNAVPPTLSFTPNVITGSTPVTLSITNPSGNAYAITAFTVTAPSGWSFSGTTITGTYFTCTASTSSLACSITKSTSPLPPGASDSITGASISGPTTSTYPVSGTFTSSVQDQSSSAYYRGSTTKVYEVASSTAIAVALNPTSTTYVAGSAAYSVTVTVSDSSGSEAGVPISWSLGGTGTGSISPSSGMTGTSGTATATFTPSDTASESNFVIATLGTNTAATSSGTGSCSAPATTCATAAVKTVAGAPASILVTYNATGTATASSPAFGTSITHYLTLSNATSSALGFAQMSSASIYYSVADAFGNPVTSGITLGSAGNTLAANGGHFGSTSNTAAAVSEKLTSSSGNLPDAYAQSGLYGWAATLSFTLTGSYTPSGGSAIPFSVKAITGRLVTSTFATSGSFQLPSATGNNAKAGTTANVRFALTKLQQGVPVMLQMCTSCANTTSGYSGHFSNGAAAISGATNSTGQFAAAFTVDTLAGSVVQFNATVTAPTDAKTTGTFTVGPSTSNQAVITIAGPVAGITVNPAFYFKSPQGPNISKAVNGSTIYVSLELADAYGNPVKVAAGQQIQITLKTTAGLLSATTVYISSGDYATNQTGSFGPVAWTLPAAIGVASTLSATAVVNGHAVSGTSAVLTVSATPTISVTSPTPLNNIIYTNVATVVFQGEANTSLGYPTSVTIASVSYKIGSGSWESATITTTGSKATWVATGFLSPGLNTIVFNATDSNGNVVVSPTFTVLVDTAAPNISFMTANNANVSSPATVSANIVDSMGDLNASSVSAAATNIQTSATKTLTASVTGTNNPGHSVTYAVSISGLTTGNWSIALSASDLAGNSNSSTITVHVTVPFAQSFAVSGTPHSATIGSFTGINASYTNLNPTSQSVVVFAVFKNSAGQTMGIGTGSLTVGAGATQSVFIAEPVGLASGTYSVSIFVFTTGNLPVSVSTSISVTV